MKERIVKRAGHTSSAVFSGFVLLHGDLHVLSLLFDGLLSFCLGFIGVGGSAFPNESLDDLVAVLAVNFGLESIKDIAEIVEEVDGVLVQGLHLLVRLGGWGRNGS